MKPRIYVILRGGLGNQLHQISAGAAVAERVGGLVRIYSHIVDTSLNPARRGFFRTFQLAEVFSPVDIKEVGWFENYILRILVRLRYRGAEQATIQEENFDHFNLKLKIYLLKGWFQSHRYLPRNFNPVALVSATDLEECTVTIHVRLTDFSLIDPVPLNASYYQTAISTINRLGKVNRLICFSDDIQGAQRILNGPEEKIFPELVSPLSPDNLLVKMSSAEFLVCSRSSLSWWAAQIVSAKGGLVFSPWTDEVGDSAWFKVEI